MLSQVAEGVLVHQSEFCRSNAAVVRGRTGVLLIDAGVLDSEMTCLANDLRGSGQSVVAGFSTHPHWDHLLWHPRLGEVPRYGTNRCAATVRARLSDPGAKSRVASMIPADIVEHVPLDLIGRIIGLPEGTTRIPWDGPHIRVIEHQAHAAGHAALLIEDRGVLVAGDMLSDVLIPMLDLSGTTDPVDEYLSALLLFDDIAGDVDVVVPGHGATGGPDEVRARIDQDRMYLQALRRNEDTADPRLSPSAAFGQDWLPAVHESQLERLTGARRQGGLPS